MIPLQTTSWASAYDSFWTNLTGGTGSTLGTIATFVGAGFMIWGAWKIFWTSRRGKQGMTGGGGGGGSLLGHVIMILLGAALVNFTSSASPIGLLLRIAEWAYGLLNGIITNWVG